MTYATEWRAIRPRDDLRSLARRGLLALLSLRQRSDQPPALRLIYCHHVFDDQIGNFERKLEYFQRLGRFVDGDEVLRIVNGEQALTGRLFHLSFDDGFRNIVTNALPVLVRLGIPATFFVPSAIIGADVETVRRYCLETTRYHGVIEMASWDDLGRAHEAGMKIGSHTRTHARFSDISGSPDLLRDEIAGSKEEIEARLGIACDHISWPYGRVTDADASSLCFVREAGYAACFGAFRGQVAPGVTDRFCIPRHHFETDWPLSHLRYFAHGGMEA